MGSQTVSVYASSDGTRFTRPYHTPYSYMHDRRFQLHHHDSRVMTMADHEGEGDASQQRKRIAVACGRCRKRKIRCSGDPGGGQPCSNCKNAGSEPCLFLRVSSTETTMRNDPNEFSYNVQDARIYANRTVAHTISYSHDLPSHEILNPYRGGSAYGYATKPFCSGMPAYSMGYVEELPDYSLNHSSQPVLGHDLVSYQTWTSRGDYGYGGSTTSLVHRPASSVAVDSANFSLSNMAAQLPGSSVSTSDRLLPAPSNHSSPYTSSQSYKAIHPVAVTDPSPVHAAAVLADMASSSYGGSFDTTGLPYSSSTTSLQTHSDQGSRTNTDAYSPETDSIFTENEQGLRSQGSAVDLHTYTYGGGEPGGSSLRRGSAASGGPASASSTHGGNHSIGSKGTMNSSSSGVSSHHHGYMAVSPIHGSASNPHHHIPLAATSAVSGDTAPTAYLAEASASSSGQSTSTICAGRVHGETRITTVGCRR